MHRTSLGAQLEFVVSVYLLLIAIIFLSNMHVYLYDKWIRNIIGNRKQYSCHVTPKLTHLHNPHTNCKPVGGINLLKDFNIIIHVRVKYEKWSKCWNEISFHRNWMILGHLCAILVFENGIDHFHNTCTLFGLSFQTLQELDICCQTLMTNFWAIITVDTRLKVPTSQVLIQIIAYEFR